MRPFKRTTFCAVLTIAPFIGMGCIGLPFLSHSGPPKLTRKEAKIYAVQREKPLSAQGDTNKQDSPTDGLAITETQTASPKTAFHDEKTKTLTKVDEKPSPPKAIPKAHKTADEPAIAATSSRPKRKTKNTSIQTTSNEVSSPKNVVPTQDSTDTATEGSDDSETKTESIRVEMARHEETDTREHVEPTANESEEIEFEMPKPVSSPVTYQNVSNEAWDAPDAEEIEESLESSLSAKADEWSSPDGFEVQVEKIEERDFQQFCLVTFREERTFTDGLREFTAEYHAQRYRFSSAEAVEKFQANPDQFVPWAGGLDIVAFQTNQEVTQGSLDFAVWHKQRLYLFSNHQNVLTFQRQPEKFAAKE